MIPSSLFAEVWEEKIIGALDVEHDTALSAQEWRTVIGIHEGEPYQARRIREAVKRLYQTGKVASVEVRAAMMANGAVGVAFLLVERRSVAAIALSGNRRLTEKEILEALRVNPGESFDASEGNVRLEGVFRLYRDEGYFNVSLQSELRRIAPDRFEMALRIDEGERARIRRITFLGQPLLSKLTLLGLVHSRKPEYFSQKRLDEDMQRLRNAYKKRGYRMARVGPPKVDLTATREVAITLPLVPSTRTELVFHDFGSLFSHAELDAFVAISAERGDANDVLEESVHAMEVAYRSRGYPFAAVAVEVREMPGKDAKAIHFTLRHGTRAKIGKIAFSGNTAFSEKQLLPFVRLKKEGIVIKSHYTEAQIQEDSDNLILFYKQNGFQAVQISPDVQFDNPQEWVVVTFRIMEGVRTRIGTVLLEGTGPVSSSALFDVVGLHGGDSFNRGVVREGAARILTALARMGYIDATVDPDVTFSADSTLAHVRYRIATGQPVYFGSLHLSGNENTRNVTLLREMLIKKGDPYDYEKILKSQQRLNQTALFSGIRFDPVRNAEDPQIQDMSLTVVELPRLAIEAGPGYGDREGVRGFLDVGYRNLWGSGRAISARASGSNLERRFSLNYKEPRVLPYDVDSTLSGTSFFIPRATFDEKTRGGTLGFERQFSSVWKGTLFYQYEDKTISNVTPGVVLTDQDTGQIIIGSLNPAITRDTRDDPFQPQTGSVFGITLRNAAQSFGSQVQLVKGVQQGSFFFSPIPRVTFALAERIGIAKRFGETALIPLSERFFLGGQSTVRGYAYQALGQGGETLHNGQPTGGNAMLLLNEEVRLSLLGSFGLVFFLDHGNIWLKERDITVSDLKSTAGAGLRYNTPAGPLRVDWGYKLDREGAESPDDFHITLGHAF